MATILVIDDDKAVAELIQTILDENGYKVSIANNGFDGIDKAQALLPELVLCDEQMPNLRGVDVCHALYNDPQLKHIPVVLISAHVGETLPAPPNCTIFLRKPFNYEDLLIVVEDSIALSE